MTPYEKLKKACSLKQRPFKLLIVCADRTRRERALNYVITQIVAEKSAAQGSLTRLEASALTENLIASLHEASQNLSLFASGSNYLLRNLDQLNASLGSKLAEILLLSNSAANFICSAESVPAKSWLNKAFASTEIIDFPELKAESLHSWAVQELRRSGLVNFQPDLPAILASLAEDNLDRLAILIEKLALSVEADSLDKHDLEQFSLSSSKLEEFKFVEQLFVQKRTQTFAYLQGLDKSSVSVFPLLAITSKMVSNYLMIQFASQQKMSSEQLQKMSGLSAWAIKKQAQTAAKVKPERLIRAVKALARADSQLKDKNLGEQQVLLELVANI